MLVFLQGWISRSMYFNLKVLFKTKKKLHQYLQSRIKATTDRVFLFSLPLPRLFAPSLIEHCEWYK